MKKILSFGLMLTLMLSLLSACNNDTDSTATASDKKLVVGAKNFTEQFVLSKILAVYLKENGYDVEEKNNMAKIGRASCREIVYI